MIKPPCLAKPILGGAQSWLGLVNHLVLNLSNSVPIADPFNSYLSLQRGLPSCVVLVRSHRWPAHICWEPKRLTRSARAITLFIGTWNIRIKSERKRIMAIVFKSIALVLPAVMVSVCQIQGLRKHPMLFLVTVNIISMSVSRFLASSY